MSLYIEKEAPPEQELGPTARYPGSLLVPLSKFGSPCIL